VPTEPDEELLTEHAALQYLLGLRRGPAWLAGEAWIAAAERGPAPTVCMLMRAAQIAADMLDDEQIALVAAQLDRLNELHGAALVAADDARWAGTDPGDWLDEPLRRFLDDADGAP